MSSIDLFTDVFTSTLPPQDKERKTENAVEFAESEMDRQISANCELDLSKEDEEKIYGRTRKCLDVISKDSKSVNNALEKDLLRLDLSNLTEDRDTRYELENGVKDIIKWTNHMFVKCLDVLRIIGEQQWDRYAVRPIIQDDEATAELLPGDILHFSFSELLPRRVKPTTPNYRYEYTRVAYYYESFFENFFEDLNADRKEVFWYKEKVVICFIHHYSSVRLVRDHDNFELKRIIDYIAYRCMPTDSATHCAHYHDYKMDEKEFSEIYVVPENRFVEFLNNH